MPIQPVIAQDEPVTLARCPVCRGAALFSIARFLGKDDRQDLQRLEQAGYQVEDTTLKLVAQVDDCRCRPEEVAKYRKVQSAGNTSPPKNSSRPILSLKNPRH